MNTKIYKLATDSNYLFKRIFKSLKEVEAQEISDTHDDFRIHYQGRVARADNSYYVPNYTIYSKGYVTDIVESVDIDFPELKKITYTLHKYKATVRFEKHVKEETVKKLFRKKEITEDIFWAATDTSGEWITETLEINTSQVTYIDAIYNPVSIEK